MTYLLIQNKSWSALSDLVDKGGNFTYLVHLLSSCCVLREALGIELLSSKANRM